MRFSLKHPAGICLVSTIFIVSGALPLMAQQSSVATPLSSSMLPVNAQVTKSDSSQIVFEHSTVRLIAGDNKNEKWIAGVEMIIAPGWKTYWRVPGDSGVPAEFDWQKSSNVKTAQVFWPAPKRYDDITGKSIGYKKHVIFPVMITPENKNQPTALDLQLYYAVCSDICVPAQARLTLDLPKEVQSSRAGQRISKFLAMVPGKPTKMAPMIKATAVMFEDKPVLQVKLSGKIGEKTDILVEGYDDAFFNAPEQVGKTGADHVFHLPIDGIDDAGELKGKTLKLTVLSGDIRFETDVKLN